MVVAVFVAALVVGSVLAYRWWTHPTLFGDRGDGLGVNPRPWSKATLSVGVTFPPIDEPRRLITFDGATAHFSENTAAAEATFWICRIAPGEDPIGSANGDLSEFCSELRPLTEGSQMTHARRPEGEYVIVTLRPTRPGKVRLDGVDLAYALGRSDFYQRGTETISMDVTLRAR